MKYHEVLSLIKNKRELQGYSQVLMAKRLLVSASYYRRIENGINRMTLTYFVKICSILYPESMVNTTTESVLEQIKGLRQSLHCSKQLMADQLHISERKYDSLEKNVSDMSFDQFLKICEVLKISAADIFNLTIS